MRRVKRFGRKALYKPDAMAQFFGFSRYVVALADPAYSSRYRLSAACVSGINAASSQRGSWRRVWRRRYREHLWCSDDPCAREVYRLAGSRILRDNPPSGDRILAPGDRAKSRSTGTAWRCRDAGRRNACRRDTGRIGFEPLAGGQSYGESFASGEPRRDGAVIFDSRRER